VGGALIDFLDEVGVPMFGVPMYDICGERFPEDVRGNCNGGGRRDKGALTTSRSGPSLEVVLVLRGDKSPLKLRVLVTVSSGLGLGHGWRPVGDDVENELVGDEVFLS